MNNKMWQASLQGRTGCWANTHLSYCIHLWVMTGRANALAERMSPPPSVLLEFQCLTFYSTSKVIQGSFSYSAGNLGTWDKSIEFNKHLTWCCSVLHSSAGWRVLPTWGYFPHGQGWSEMDSPNLLELPYSASTYSSTECPLGTGKMLLEEPIFGGTVTALDTYLCPLLCGPLP